ncbi:nucleoid-associated protein YejK [Psychromonas antarctica]|jgi:nucleoid-associated protein|uniref:nucleoid-associated protein YejK n=1 Tax=Psychromonas antarctica TaxID=67573 RepID=UPI001EE877CD|nr:nucleoid-associated protein YejK [Psychromonas antarctica]MCG6201319.1 nucleoid-associated protein YejK [Psychromonas antarctica]
MKISANNIILHSLNYSPEGVLQCKMREGELPISPSIEQFLMELHRTYQSKTNKAFAAFAPETEKTQLFQRALQKEVAGELDFVSFSQQAANFLVDELQKHDFAEQGILLISKYSWTASDYLLIALLQNNESISVNDNLELQVSQHIETSKIQLVARIDLTLLARDPQSNRYISFIKGRVGRKVADFFLDFMGAQEGFDAKVQNQVLMKAVDDFCEKEALPVAKKQEVREVAFQYCKDQLKQGDDIDLSNLSEQMQDAPKLDGSFYDFVSEDYQLETKFPADRSVVRKLTKYVGQGGGVSISFDQKHLGERIQYDADSDTLTIQGIPPNLREQLKRDANSSAETKDEKDEDLQRPPF